MDKIIIEGERPLKGTVQLSGSKNCSLPVLAATLLASSGESVIRNVPDITDVHTMLDILRALGARVSWSDGTVRVNSEKITTHHAPFDEVRRMRASFYVAGPLLSRLGRASVPLPGGCHIGTRPVDYHIDGFQRMGAKASVQHGKMVAQCDHLHGAPILLDARWASLGATVNLMLAASLADGVTTIENAARDPELVECANFLNRMGANVTGHGTSTLNIEGVEEMHGCEFTASSDRIEAGTLLIAGAVTKGDVRVEPIPHEQLTYFLDLLANAGVDVERGDDWIRARYVGRPRATDVATAPFPGFPTDLQAPAVVLMALADGRCAIHETIHDRRFAYVDELRRMGAKIELIDHSALVTGVPRLTGAPLVVPDIRAGAALILAALSAHGQSVLSKIEPIDRGYENFVDKLSDLGACIGRTDEYFK